MRPGGWLLIFPHSALDLRPDLVSNAGTMNQTLTVSLPCLRGNATLSRATPGDEWTRANILTGKRKRPDTLHWSLYGPREGVKMAVMLQGLYRGSYGDAIADCVTLHASLIQLGAQREAGDLARACAANGVTL